jgi:hypothetical protein
MFLTPAKPDFIAGTQIAPLNRNPVSAFYFFSEDTAKDE